MSFKLRLIRHSLNYGFYSNAYLLIRFIIGLILARLLSPEEYGLVGMIQVFSGFILILNDIGFSYAILRSEEINETRVLDFLTICFGGAQMLLFLMLSYPLALFYDNLTLFLPSVLISFSFLVYAFSIGPRSVLRKTDQFKFIGIAQLIIGLLSGVISILLAFNGFSYWAIIFQDLLYMLLIAIVFRVSTKLRFQFFSVSSSKEILLKYKGLIKNLTGFRFINYFARNWDNLLVGKIYGDAELGIYSRGYSFIYFIISTVSNVVSTVLIPTLSKDTKKDDFEANAVFALKLLSIIALPVSSVLILFPDHVTFLLWGEKWMEVAQLLPYFGTAILIQLQTSVVGELFIFRKQDRQFFILGLVNSVLLMIGISFGALVSVLSIAKFYVFTNVAIAFVFTLYWAFYRSFRFSWKLILLNWAPTVILLSAMIFYMEKFEWRLIILSIYWIHVLVNSRSYFSRFYSLMFRR